MEDSNILFLLQNQYPILADYIKLVVDRRNKGLIRESYLYLRFAEEYIIEIMARANNLSMYEYNAEVYGNTIRSVYSLSEELYNKGILKYTEKNTHDFVRKFSNMALHIGVSERVLEQNWNKCYSNILFCASALIKNVNVEEIKDDDRVNDLEVYTINNFKATMELEFGENPEDDIKEANELLIDRINFNALKYEKAVKIVNYYISSIRGGTIPILAANYAIKMSKE